MAKDDVRSRKAIWGATVIAVIVFFTLNFTAGIIFERQSSLYAFTSALWKAGVFGAVFHYLHNFIARILGWYKGE